jgi:hypothetical protein
MIKENLIAERIAIESYADMAATSGQGPDDAAHDRGILANEEEHADDLASLLATLDPRRGDGRVRGGARGLRGRGRRRPRVLAVTGPSASSSSTTSSATISSRAGPARARWPRSWT